LNPRSAQSGIGEAVKRAIAVFGLVLATAGFFWSRIPARNDRAWIPEQSRTARVRLDGRRVAVENVRNFDWSATSADPGPVPRWETREYDLDAIESLWYILTPFDRDWRGPAHAFLSFGFSNGQFLAISVEARREIGETYSIAKGLLKRFELTYVVGDERDLFGLRVLRSNDDVYAYPVRVTPQAAATLFLEMLAEANRLASKPAFYGSLRNNCTTRILNHVNRIAPEPLPYSWRILLPGYSDAFAHQHNLLDTHLPLDSARAEYLVSGRVREYIRDPDFSSLIRRRTGERK
jgi:hypothetical protein